MFNYKNEEQKFEQSFSINVKKYNGHQAREPLLSRSLLGEKDLTATEWMDRERPEGMYLFLP